MRLLKENKILSTLKESEIAADGLTLKEATEKIYNGYMDIDVSDSEIDMAVAFVYDVNEAVEDEYNKFISILAERTKIVKTVTSKWGDTLVCDFSSVFKPYNEELKEVFDMDNSEFDSDEAWAEAVVNLEPLISGNAGESTYKELNEILEGKNKEEPVNESNDSIFTSFRPSGQSEGLLGRLWFNIGDKTETVDLFYVDGEYRLVYGMIIPGYVQEFIDSYGYDKLLQEAIAYVEKNKGMNEAVNNSRLDKAKIAKFIKDSVNDLMTTDYTNSRYILDDDLAIFVGWSDGYDETPEEGEIYKEDSPTWRPNVGIKVRNDYDWADYDFLNFPWYPDGEVWDTGVTLNKADDYSSEADWMIKNYPNIVEAHNKGEIFYTRDEEEAASGMNESASLNESKAKDDMVYNEDLLQGVDIDFTCNGESYLLKAHWYDNFDFDEEVESGNISEDANPDDWWAIYFDILDSKGEDVDGGILVTDKETFKLDELGNDLIGLCGWTGENFKIVSERPDISKPGKKEKEEPNETIKESESLEGGPINPDDKDYYDGKLFKVGLYPGAGYELTMFKVYADNEEEALCLVVAECERKKNFGLIYPVEEIKEFVEKDYKKEFDERYAEQSDSEYDWFAFAEEYLSYIYVDATMEGASQPYFVHGENLVVEEISDNDDSDKGSMNESEDRIYYKNGEFIEPKWFKNKKLYNEFKKYVDSMLQGGRAIDDPEYVNSLTPEEYESLLVDTWMKDQELINMFEERLDEEDLKEGVKENSPIGKTFICKKSVHHPNLGDLVRRGEIVTIKSYSPKAKAYIADTEAGVYVTEETLKNNFEEYSGPIFGAVTADGKVVIKFDNEEEALDYADERNEWDDNQLEVKQLNEEVTFSKPESATDSTNKQSAKVRDVLDYELEDDDTETGGVSFNGETVRDFIADPDMGVKDTDSVDSLNKVLTTCGIKPISEGYAESKYRGDDYWELSDYYERGSIDKEELASRLFDLYSDYNGARGAYIEITGETDMPKVDGDTDEIKEVEAKELSDLVTKWDEDHKSIPRGRWIAKEGKKFVAIDNRTEDCWTEEFDSKEQAMSWLNDEFEMSDLNEAVVEDKNAYYYEIPISYGPGDVSNINVVVTNGETSGYSYEEIQKALNGVTIYGNDLSGEEYMMDIKLSDGKWLEYKGKEGTDRYTQYVFTVIKSYKESAEDGTHEVNYLINDGEYAISILERLTGGEADFLVKAKDGKGNSGILSGYDQVEGYEFTEEDEPFYSEGMYSEEDVIDLIHKFKPDLEVTKVSRILKLSDTYTEIDVPKGSISATPSIAKEINSKSADKIKHVRKAD